MRIPELLRQAIQDREEEPRRKAERERVRAGIKELVLGFSELAEKYGVTAQDGRYRRDTMLVVPLESDGGEEIRVGVNVYAQDRAIVWIDGLRKSLFMNRSPSPRAEILKVDGKQFDGDVAAAERMGETRRHVSEWYKVLPQPVTQRDIDHYQELLEAVKSKLSGRE